MALDSQKDKRSPTLKDTKINGEQEELLTSQQIMVGSSEVMTHEERQAYLKQSKLGKLLGVSHLL